MYNAPGAYENREILKEFSSLSSLTTLTTRQTKKKKCLIIITGYDSDITQNIINNSDDDLICFCIQTGTKLDNERRNQKLHRKIADVLNIKICDIDSFDEDNGFNTIENIIKKFSFNYHITIISLGPKSSYIYLYKICKKYLEICIQDAETQEINTLYSIGIGSKLRNIYKRTDSTSFRYTWLPGSKIDDVLLDKCGNFY